jgi:hypothetical protein
MSVAQDDTTSATVSPDQPLEDLSRRSADRDDSRDRLTWLQVTEIPIAPTVQSQASQSTVLATFKFQDTEDEVNSLLQNLPPVPPNTARVYDHIVQRVQDRVQPTETDNTAEPHIVDLKLQNHLTTVPGLEAIDWDQWSIEKVTPIPDPSRSNTVRNQWQNRSHPSAAPGPVCIGTYTFPGPRFHKTLLQFFPVPEDSLISEYRIPLTQRSFAQASSQSFMSTNSRMISPTSQHKYQHRPSTTTPSNVICVYH